jgi:hypothetical protein
MLDMIRRKWTIPKCELKVVPEVKVSWVQSFPSPPHGCLRGSHIGTLFSDFRDWGPLCHFYKFYKFDDTATLFPLSL